VSKFEVGKEYTISAYWKKSLVEVEQYMHSDGRMLNTEVLWRNGTLKVKVTNEDDAKYLQGCLGKNGDTCDFRDYEEVEFWDAFDGISEDLIFIGDWPSESEQEALEDKYKKSLDNDDCFSRYDFLTNNGFESVDGYYYIEGGIYVEEFETDET